MAATSEKAKKNVARYVIPVPVTKLCQGAKRCDEPIPDGHYIELIAVDDVHDVNVKVCGLCQHVFAYLPAGTRLQLPALRFHTNGHANISFVGANIAALQVQPRQISVSRANVRLMQSMLPPNSAEGIPKLGLKVRCVTYKNPMCRRAIVDFRLLSAACAHITVWRPGLRTVTLVSNQQPTFTIHARVPGVCAIPVRALWCALFTEDAVLELDNGSDYVVDESVDPGLIHVEVSVLEEYKLGPGDQHTVKMWRHV
jgi:hypothetical protein